PAQFRAGRAGGRWRHRCNPVHRLPAFRLRLRPHHPAGNRRHRDDGRDRVRLDAEAVPVTAAEQAGGTTTPRTWARISPAERVLRSCFYVLALVAVLWSLQTVEIIPEFLYDAPQQTADLFARMWPIDWAWYPKVVHQALMETLHTATLGTILAVALAS